MKLTLRILKAWKYWVSLSEDSVDWCQKADQGDGLTYQGGYWANFWYLLNTEWLHMNNKRSSRTQETRPYQEPLNFYVK